MAFSSIHLVRCSHPPASVICMHLGLTPRLAALWGSWTSQQLLFGDSPDFSITLISYMALCIHSESILISASVSPILLNVFSLGLILFHKAISKLHLTFPWSSGFCCGWWKSGVEKTICLAPPPPGWAVAPAPIFLLVSAALSNLESNWLWVS